MKAFAKFVLLAMVFSLLLSCSLPFSDEKKEEQKTQYNYCVFVSDEVCLPGPFSECFNGGFPSNECPFGSTPGGGGSTFTDGRDGQVYSYVKIGSQTWMAQNLNYETDDSRCYDDDESYCTTYGSLYYWEDALTACPAGWRLPSYEDWDELINTAGGTNIAGKNLRKDASNTYGFSALHSYICYISSKDECVDYSYSYYNNYGYWWSTEKSYPIYINGYTAGGTVGLVYDYLLSVRCIKK